MTSRGKKSRKRALVAGLLGLAATSGMLASAASLGVTGNTLGAGTVVIASCDTDGVSLTYTNTYDTTTGAYRTSAVLISGLNNACNAKKLDITLKDATGASLGAASIASLSLPTGTTTASVAISPTASAASITGAAIVIAG